MKHLLIFSALLLVILSSCVQDNTDLYNEACEYEEEMEYDKAIELLSKALELNPKDIECLNNRAWDYYDLGQKEKAITDFEKMLDIDPQSTGAMYGIAYIKYENEFLEDALKNFNQIIEIQASLATQSNRSKSKHSIKAPLDLVFEFKEIIEDSLGIVSELDSVPMYPDNDSLQVPFDSVENI